MLEVSDAERCYATALRILRYRFNSGGELRRKLQRKQFDNPTIDETLTRLKSENWLDDERFAAAYVRTRQLKKIGPRRIRRELQAAGVNGEVAKDALSEHADPEREREDLLAVCRRRHLLLYRRKGAEYAQSQEGRNKLTVYLLNQGYDGALVQDVIKEVLRNPDYS